jgi:hypothetical protein
MAANSTPTATSSFTTFLNQFTNRRHGTKDPDIPPKRRITDLRSLEEAKSFAEGGWTNGMSRVQYSKLAFKALLANKASLNDLLGFLKDPGVNLPQSRNVTVLITHYRSRGQSLPMQFYATLQQLLTLGMIHPLELLQVLDNLPETDYLKLEGIWKSMKACRVIPIRTDCARRILDRVDALTEKRDRRELATLRLELYQHIFPLHQKNVSDESDLGHYLAYWATSVVLQSPKPATYPNRDTLLHIISLVRSSQRQKRHLLSATANLLSQKPFTASELPQWRSLIIDWLDLLLETEPGRRHALSDPRQLNKFYDMISEHLALYELAPFFKKLPTFITSRIIAQSWLPRLYPGSWSAADSFTLERDIMIIPTTDLRSPRYVRRTDHFADIVIALARRGLDYEAPMTNMVKLCHAIYGTQGVFDLVRTWRFAQIRIIPEAFGEILRSLSQTTPWTALAIYQQARLWIGSSPELLPKLIEEGTSPNKIFKILNHKDPTNSVPVHRRDSPKNNLHNTRNTLIHVVADAFSRSQGVRGNLEPKTLRPFRSRQMFRNVYLAYRYLVTRQSPVHPLMSRALVRAGIIRPLENNEWVNTSRIQWILQVVGRVEGQDVAMELDKKIYEWRGKVHRYIMSRRRQQGSDSRHQQITRAQSLGRTPEKATLFSCQSITLAPSDSARMDTKALEEGEGDASNSLEAKLSPFLSLSHHETLKSNDRLSSLEMMTNTYTPKSLHLQSSIRPTTRDCFTISPQFEEMEGVPLSPPVERMPITSMAQSGRHEIAGFEALSWPEESTQSLVGKPPRSFRDFAPRQRTPCTPALVKDIIYTSSINPSQLENSPSPATSRPKTTQVKDTSTSSTNGDSLPFKISRQPHGPAFLISTVRGGIRDELTQFKTTRSSLIRYQIDENINGAGEDMLSRHPMRKGMTTRGEVMVAPRYRRNRDGVLVKVEAYRSRR